MQFHCLYVSSVSACFELENSAPYYAETPYDVYVNGALALPGVRTNVFSLFDLTPDTSYAVRVGDVTVTVHTLSETACVDVREYGAVGDGVHDDTTAIQSAIHTCPPGGRVRIPAGTYAIRPLVLPARCRAKAH